MKKKLIILKVDINLHILCLSSWVGVFKARRITPEIKKNVSPKKFDFRKI